MRNTLANIGNFLTTLVMPRRMKRYRKMSLLFSVLLFFALSYLVIAPDIIRLSREQKKDPDKVRTELVFNLEPLINNESNELLPHLPTKLTLDKSTMSASFDYTYSKFTIYYQTDTIKNSLTLVFDMTDDLKVSNKDINDFHTQYQTRENERDLLVVFTRHNLTFFPRRDANYTLENNEGMIVSYETGGSNITDITKKTISKDLTHFIAGYLNDNVANPEALAALTENASAEVIDSLPIEASLTSNVLNVTFDYIYREIPFTFTSGIDTYNMVVVFDLYNTSNRTSGRFDYLTYHQKAIHDVNDKDLLFVFETKQARYYHTHDTTFGTENAQSHIDQLLSYSYLEIDVEHLPKNARDLTYFLARYLIINRILFAKQNYTLSSFIMNVIIPLIMIFLFYIIFKRGGVLKKFKEYYNIAAIAFVPTSIIIFLLGFFISYTEAFIIYFPVQALFYIFCIFRINVELNPEDETKPTTPILKKDIIDTSFESHNSRSQDMVSSDYKKTK